MPTLPLLKPEKNANDSPHVVLLGAGASLASFPNGERNGRLLPLMRNFVEVVGLSDLLEENGIDNGAKNFEELYSDLHSSAEHSSLARKLEDRIREYFVGMELPDHVTLYDEIVLSLRKKDLIATFNWDPFLPLAYRRNCHLQELPQMVFLHGCVAVGVCKEHRAKGYLGDRCLTCGELLQPVKLLYPVREKNYRDDPFISNEWDVLESFLQRAYLFTIFGYSAPTSDIDAVGLLKNAWQHNPTKALAQIDLINTGSPETLEQSWNEFFVRDHYGIHTEIHTTRLARFPRRTCDAFAAANLLCEPWAESNRLPEFQDLKAFQSWVQPLVDEEVAYREKGSPFSCIKGYGSKQKAPSP